MEVDNLLKPQPQEDPAPATQIEPRYQTVPSAIADMSGQAS